MHSSRSTADEMVDILHAHFEEALARALELRRRATLHVCVGGPWHGKRHGLFAWPARVQCFQVERAKWAVYQFGPAADDGRLFFRGYATSQAKGRRLQLVREARP